MRFDDGALSDAPGQAIEYQQQMDKGKCAVPIFPYFSKPDPFSHDLKLKLCSLFF